MIADIEFLFSHDSKEAFYLIPVEWIHTCVINFAIKLNLVGGFANITENRKIMCARSQSTCVSRLLFSNALILDRTTRIGWNVSPPLTARPTSTSPTVISGWSLLCFGRRERNEKSAPNAHVVRSDFWRILTRKTRPFGAQCICPPSPTPTASSSVHDPLWISGLNAETTLIERQDQKLDSFQLRHE